MKELLERPDESEPNLHQFQQPLPYLSPSQNENHDVQNQKMRSQVKNPFLHSLRSKNQELKLLFDYYDEYGPLWSRFESLIPGTGQNLLKNKFYSTLRSLLRKLISNFKQCSHQKLSFTARSLPSKLLVEIYEGKKSFRKVKGFLRSLLDKSQFLLEKINLKGEFDLKCEFIITKIQQNLKTSSKLSLAVKVEEKCFGEESQLAVQSIGLNPNCLDRGEQTYQQEKRGYQISKAERNFYANSYAPFFRFCVLPWTNWAEFLPFGGYFHQSK